MRLEYRWNSAFGQYIVWSMQCIQAYLQLPLSLLCMILISYEHQFEPGIEAGYVTLTTIVSFFISNLSFSSFISVYFYLE